MIKEEATGAPNPPRREQIRVRLSQLRNSRQRKILGIAEIAGLAGASVLLLLALISYFYFLAPARARLDTLQLERARLEKQFKMAQEGYQHNTDTKTTVETINTSLDQFENQKLVARGSGRMALYSELNQLIRSNGLRNTAGPAYSALLPLGTKQSAGDSGNAKWQSVFPGIGVSVTVEGSYQNLRHFLRAIETSRQFLIINTVELETANESSMAAASADSGGTAGGGQKTGMVSLRLDMATYFQRTATESQTAAPESSH